jgi:hypothetical protein
MSSKEQQGTGRAGSGRYAEHVEVPAVLWDTSGTTDCGVGFDGGPSSRGKGGSPGLSQAAGAPGLEGLRSSALGKGSKRMLREEDRMTASLPLLFLSFTNDPSFLP